MAGSGLRRRPCAPAWRKPRNAFLFPLATCYPPAVHGGWPVGGLGAPGLGSCVHVVEDMATQAAIREQAAMERTKEDISKDLRIAFAGLGFVEDEITMIRNSYPNLKDYESHYFKHTDMWVEKGLLEKHRHHPFQPRDAA